MIITKRLSFNNFKCNVNVNLLSATLKPHQGDQLVHQSYIKASPNSQPICLVFIGARSEVKPGRQHSVTEEIADDSSHGMVPEWKQDRAACKV